jgi:hypothetical protein
MEASKKKPPLRAALLIYLVAVMLLAWWPWNVWLIVGATYAGKLRPTRRRVFPENSSDAVIDRANGRHDATIPAGDLETLREYLRIAR